MIGIHRLSGCVFKRPYILALRRVSAPPVCFVNLDDSSNGVGSFRARVSHRRTRCVAIRRAQRTVLRAFIPRPRVRCPRGRLTRERVAQAGHRGVLRGCPETHIRSCAGRVARRVIGTSRVDVRAARRGESCEADMCASRRISTPSPKPPTVLSTEPYPYFPAHIGKRLQIAGFQRQRVRTHVADPRITTKAGPGVCGVRRGAHVRTCVRGKWTKSIGERAYGGTCIPW